MNTNFQTPKSKTLKRTETSISINKTKLSDKYENKNNIFSVVRIS